jgi:hypothetical protein
LSRKETRVLRELLGPRRVRFTDDQRVRLAAKAKKLSRHVLTEIGAIVTPDTLLAWHRRLIARRDRRFDHLPLLPIRRWERHVGVLIW